MNPVNEQPLSTWNSSPPASIESLPALVDRLAGVLASPHFHASDRAALKRHAPGQVPPLAFYRLWLRQLGTELPSESQSAAWALLAWGLAMMGTGAQRHGRPLGRALAESGYSESRLERLLGADGDSLHALFASMVRFLAAKGECFAWEDAAHLLLITDDQKRQTIHRRIAAAFYRHQPPTGKE